ncbi:hypothetical protein F5887DRAFT_1087226 [Amanita rubescens]|nr:hypothetical protein F5887DRAFT_1087226 [Amanita rubescens]
MPRASVFRPRDIPCPVKGCGWHFTNKNGLGNHLRTGHKINPCTRRPTQRTSHANVEDEHRSSEPEDAFEPFHDPHDDPFNDSADQNRDNIPASGDKNAKEHVVKHEFINGRPCNSNGEFLPDGAPPPPWDERAPDDFSPFESRESYELADLIFRRNEMSKDEFNCLMQIWARTLSPHRDPPFRDVGDMHDTIDAVELGGVPWQSFTITFKETDDKEPDDAPWKAKSYDVWIRDPREILKLQLGNRDFAGEMDYAPKKVYDREKKKRRYQDLMSGQWAWDQADILARDPENHGATFCPIILGKPETIRYGDGYYRRTIWGIGPYIADYPEQAGQRSHEHTRAAMNALSVKALWDDYGIIAGTLPFTSDFPRADIHELISPDLLHQVIKGTFKDHLVAWVEAYIKETYVAADAREILADIDRRIRAVPLFPGLRRFPEGRGYKQWTGDDSKALMKVYLPAIVNHVPDQMVKAIALFLEFCYLVRRHVLDDDDLDKLDDVLSHYLQEREIFRTTGVRSTGFDLPRQHALCHYRDMIMMFGAPNGLCSSITESKHIKAVRKPWRRSSRFNALSQMLLTNQRLDKLAACTVDFRERRMLDNSIWANNVGQQPPPTANDDDADCTAVDDREVKCEVKLAVNTLRRVPRKLDHLAAWLHVPHLPKLISLFLYREMNPDCEIPIANIPLNHCPRFMGDVYTYPSAVATFYAPSDLSGIGGGFRERIRCAPEWRSGEARQDCVFVRQDPNLPGIRGLRIAQVKALLKFKHNRVTYPCALVSWFKLVGDSPCDVTGMWVVGREIGEDGQRLVELIHLDTVFRSAHLIGIADPSCYVPYEVDYMNSLDAFKTFYVNKYIDYHTHEVVF